MSSEREHLQTSNLSIQVLLEWCIIFVLYLLIDLTCELAKRDGTSVSESLALSFISSWDHCALTTKEI